MPEPQAPRKVTSINSKVRFLTTGEPLPPVVFSASMSWLILSAPWGGIPELLAPCWEESTYRWRLCVRTPSCSFRHCSFILVFHYRSTKTRESKSPPAEPHTGGRHWYDGVLPDAPKGSLTTLLSPPQCHAALCTVPHTLASVDQSPVHCPKMLPLLRDEDAKGWILEGWET
jgi:hypothetical protein